MSKQEKPGHYTAAGTKKHQANGPAAWSKVFQKVAGRDGREGEGVRAALAFAVEHEERFIAWAEAHPTLWAPATTAPPPAKAKAKADKPAKPAKPAAKAKAKADKPGKAKAKADKPAKPAEGQQSELPISEAK